MTTTKKLGLLSLGLVLGIFLISAISLISAQTLIAGKIYTSGYSDIVSDAEVTAVCNSYDLTTTSLSDGTYAVRFEESLCELGDSVSVSSVKGDLSGSSSGTIVECDGTDNCDSGLFSIINLAIKSSSNQNTGGSSGRYYFCGNNRCDSGETINTCPKDCTPAVNETIIPPIETNTGETNTETENQETIPPITTQSRFARITGAVTGVLGTTGWIIVIIFIVGILGLSITVRMIRKARR